MSSLKARLRPLGFENGPYTYVHTYACTHRPLSKPRGLKRASSEDMVALKAGKRHALKAGREVEHWRLARAVALKAEVRRRA